MCATVPEKRDILPHRIQSALWWGSTCFFLGSACFVHDALGFGESFVNLVAGFTFFVMGRAFFLWGSQTWRCNVLFKQAAAASTGSCVPLLHCSLTVTPLGVRLAPPRRGA